MRELFEPLNRWVMKDDGYGRAPRICVDARGCLWVVWISWHEKGEVVRAAIKNLDGSWEESFVCSKPAKGVCSLDVTSWGDGVLVAWIDDGDKDASGLKLRHIVSKESLIAACLIIPGRRRPFGVSVASDNERFMLAWTAKELGGRSLQIVLGDDPQHLGDPIVISGGNGLDVYPSTAFSCGNPWIAWQHMNVVNSRIHVGMVQRDGLCFGPIEIGDCARGIYSSSSILGDGNGGIWLGCQSDVKDGNDPGLVRWIEIMHVNRDGIVREPLAPMTDVDRAGRGEDQGFESPSILQAPSGRIIIIGLGSQSLRRQDLYGETWTQRGKIESDGWQCRGRHFSACVTSDGLVVVGREREGIVVRLLPLGQVKQTNETPKLYEVVGDTTKKKRASLSLQKNFSTVAGRQVLFGDIHQHTMASDGTGTAAETYQRARVRYGDDFVAIADHESFLGKRTTPGEWAEHCLVADDFYEPGSFITLAAFEWTGAMHPGPGHKVVYLPALGGPVFSRDDDASKTSEGLIKECQRIGALVIPHHVGWTGADMENHNPLVQSCWEIVSCHGAYEREGEGQIIGTRGDDKSGQFIADALDKGLRFGFTGGSDGHGLNWHHGVCRMEDSHRSGLTAVFAEEATRQGVLNAIAERRCYATSGAKIGLWFEVAGALIGESILAEQTMSFKVIINGTAPIDSVVLVTNGGKETPLEASGLSVEIQGVLPPPKKDGWAYYFIRVEQKDGHVAWSSPIWIDSALGSSLGKLLA